MAAAQVKTSDFDYELPPHLIAQTPVEPRDASRLMVTNREDGEIVHTHFHLLGQYLRPGDLVVCNDTRVIPARLNGRKVPTGGKVELLLTVKRSDTLWEALARGRRVPVGGQLEFPGGADGQGPGEPLRAELGERIPSGGRLVRFDRPVDQLLERVGRVPLPPYIHEELRDDARYQTIYADERGSAAAPTAGLHFTIELIDGLQKQGIEFRFLTLHIGVDTFLPIREENAEQHPIHSEYCLVSEETSQAVNRARAEKRRIVAAGTTVVRALETAARAATGTGLEVVAPFAGWTELFIYPGYSFQAVDCLITNFHLPRSTLLLLVAAFAGKDLLDRAYREAMEKKYRFYSFGDAMLIV
jgi:S-adenosylmethionine:tRNA ribosyltransferase-isomerase